jgi:hypothetical protein
MLFLIENLNKSSFNNAFFLFFCVQLYLPSSSKSFLLIKKPDLNKSIKIDYYLHYLILKLKTTVAFSNDDTHINRN